MGRIELVKGVSHWIAYFFNRDGVCFTELITRYRVNEGITYVLADMRRRYPDYVVERGDCAPLYRVNQLSPV